MKLTKFFSALAVFAASVLPMKATYAANDYPVVFVHGFAGFGREEVFGYKYWGGLTDLQEGLRSQGHEAYTAVVGPFSSNWDRAVELYYQIKGGCVDYGENHSAAFGHARTVDGKCFPGLYPQWDEARPVHLVAHSMGGQTARMLAQLLEEGHAAEHTLGGASPLFQGGKTGWVKSVTTIASPNNGTTLSNIVTDFVPFAQQFVGGIAGAAGILDQDQLVYDFKLEQWGLQRQPGEGFLDYQARVMASRIWYDTRDLSPWSLSPDGAAEENAWVATRPGVYYFSYATRTTFTAPFSGWSYPIVSTNPLIGTFAGPLGMGAYTRNQPGTVAIDSSWWPNDAVVNTKSMNGPWNAEIVTYAGAAQPGKWNHLGLMDGFDHFDIVGWTLFWDSQRFYLDHVKFLKTL